MVEIDFNKLRIGDRLVRTKGGIFTKHHVIYMGFWNHQHLIAENQVNFGVRYITLDQFLSEGKLDRVEYNNFSQDVQISILDRVNKKIGTEYDLPDYNCEHFTNEILTGIVESKQIQNAIAIAAIGVGLSLLAFGMPSSKNKSYV